MAITPLLNAKSSAKSNFTQVQMEDGGATRAKVNKGKGKGKRPPWQNTYTAPTNNGGHKGRKGKGKQPHLGSRQPKFTGNCSHCGIVGHMARDCYKRQQGTPQTVLKQKSTTTIKKKPALIEFQQFPTFVQRHLEGENEDDNENQKDDEGKEKGNNLNSLTDATSVESSSTTMEESDPKETTLTWGHTHQSNLGRPRPHIGA